MPDWKKLTENLEKHGFAVSRFATAAEAAAYIDAQLDGRTIGVGGSMTVKELGLYERLSAHNRVHWHWTEEGPAAREAAIAAPVYLCSANAFSETGEIVNIDGVGNRVSATLYGHEEVWFVVGVNKIAPDESAALRRARNVASPLNNRRTGKKTPCTASCDQCYDCQSPDRGCAALVVLWRKPAGIKTMRVVLVEEKLGY